MVWLKRGLALAALGVMLYLFWPLIDEIGAAANLFLTASWIWLSVVLLVHILSYSFLTWLNALALQPFAGHIQFIRLAAVLTAIAFIEVAIPSAGASGVALRARLLGKHGSFSIEGSTFSLVLETIYNAFAMATLGALGVFYLLHRGDLTGIQISGIAVGGLAVAGAGLGGWRTIHNRERSRLIVLKLTELWNRLGGRFRSLEKERVEKRLSIFHKGLVRLADVPRWKFWVAAYGRIAFDVATLGTCFILFQHPIAIGTLLVGYALMLLLSGLAALPGGVGLAEVSIPVIFASLGVPGSVALAAGLTYRLITFWLLRFIGFASWQILERRS